MWIHYLDPHIPYTPPASHREMFLWDRWFNEKILVPSHPKESVLDLVPTLENVSTYEINRRWEINNSNVGGSVLVGPMDYYIAQYDAEIRLTDDQIGILMEKIESLGLKENSIIIFFPDHGESLGDHNFYFEHGRFPYNACLNVPLFIYHPDLEPREVISPASIMDVFPTLMQFAGLTAQSQGMDLTPLLLGREISRNLFAEVGTRWSIKNPYQWFLATRSSAGSR